ncbi:hypothetical protein [Halobacillus sp. Nhm2S1]|uniref:hypothetical protein n=1 Tax=Halobacillus sp. Nhm2S1 TaxID=2866716 RepID=UPI001C72F036|nr:hypothetical protein [Halobacillus sp. Nhm2S1]MBX0359560.1 hypothetical protein [Halobacillus sp. Nhm2S1]
MKQQDKVEKKLKALPKHKMDNARKQRNYYALQRPRKESKSKYFAYPLTIFTFLVMIFVGYTIIHENKDRTTTTNEAYTNMQMYFEGIKPIYSNSHIPDTVGVPEEYHKGVALGYLYNASIFYTPEGEKVNPLEINNNINAYFDYKEERLDNFSEQPKLIADTKPTWLYLNSAAELIDDKSISESLIGLSEKISEITANNSSQHNYSVYKEVSQNISEIVMEINQVTGGSVVVYEGESKNWFVRLQPLDDDDYLLHLNSKGLEENNVSNISISGLNSKFSVESNFSGKSKYIFGDSLPENVIELEEINIVIRANGMEDTLSLNRSTEVRITP